MQSTSYKKITNLFTLHKEINIVLYTSEATRTPLVVLDTSVTGAFVIKDGYVFATAVDSFNLLAAFTTPA